MTVTNVKYLTIETVFLDFMWHFVSYDSLKG